MSLAHPCFDPLRKTLGGLRPALVRRLPWMMMTLGAALMVFALWSAATPGTPPALSGLPTQAALPLSEITPPPEHATPIALAEPAPPPEALPAGQLLITPQRQTYQSGQLRLVIPQLSIDLTVEGGVAEANLAAGPGLYDYAQLPGEPGGNVSIAGHRDIHGSVFYYVDRLGSGDRLYLVYEDTVYVYAYEATRIVSDDDWGPIHTQGFSCLTLTSCDPIGTSLNRIIVTARLQEATPFTDAYSFAPTT